MASSIAYPTPLVKRKSKKCLQNFWMYYIYTYIYYIAGHCVPPCGSPHIYIYSIQKFWSPFLELDRCVAMCYDLSTSSRRSRRGGMRPPPCRTSGYVQTYRRVVHERDPSGVPRHHSRTHDARCWRPVHAVRGLGSDGRRDVSRSRGVGSKRPARTSPHSGTCAHHVRTVARDDTCDVAGERCPCPEYKCKSYTRGNKV